MTTIFDVTDSEGTSDLGRALLLYEREAVMTASNEDLYERHKCALFEVLDVTPGATASYVVATLYSDHPLSEYPPGDWFDAKVMSGFPDIESARFAYERYGPSYLGGDRLTWSQFRRI